MERKEKLKKQASHFSYKHNKLVLILSAKIITVLKLQRLRSIVGFTFYFFVNTVICITTLLQSKKVTRYLSRSG